MWDINTVNWPLLEGKPIKWLEEIKKSKSDNPKMISGITKGEELRKIKKGLAGILEILVKEYPIITPKIVAKVAESEATLILIRNASIICSFWNNFPYHFKEKPFHNITLLFSLNE